MKASNVEIEDTLRLICPSEACEADRLLEFLARDLGHASHPGADDRATAFWRSDPKCSQALTGLPWIAMRGRNAILPNITKFQDIRMDLQKSILGSIVLACYALLEQRRLN